MAGKKGRKEKKFSIDEYLAEYKKRMPKEESRGKSVEGALIERKRDIREDIAREDSYRREGAEPESWSPPEKKDSGYEELPGVKEIVRNRPLIFITYLLRSFAITLMAFLMLFVILHDVMGKKPVVGYFDYVGDYFVDFVSYHLPLFATIAIALFFLQALYYLFARIAKKKWKVYSREEIVYSIAFALVGLAGSALIVYALGL